MTSTCGARLGGGRDGGRVLVGDEVELRHDDEGVCREVGRRVHDVRRDPAVVERRWIACAAVRASSSELGMHGPSAAQIAW